MGKNAIEIESLKFAYGRNEVLKGVDLEVPQGSIFGFLGRNGAGKTTTIKLLLGLLKPRAGACRIQGINPQNDEIAVRRTVGYMAEDQQMYGWMRIGQIVKWVGSFYPGWDDKLTNQLLDMLELPTKSKVKTLSKGQNSRLALLLALGHKPKVVILDDPTLGLDPIARKDFLRHVIELLQTNGVTVFFSSHLLYEIEPVADHVAILDNGVIIKAAKTELLRESVRKFILCPKPEADLSSIAPVLDVVRSGENVSVTIEDCDEQKRAAIKEMASNTATETGLNLDEIFEAYVIGNKGKAVKV
ncbi:MAG: ABC transporter ATP-binding protein [Sedimentisphaerales bacterium]|nr:ABC transporter ATP-binding protein [Sedimentisphaerales bacterium]